MLLALGFSINVLTMFGMVLVIGIVVDDAIVVVENVERIMSEEGLSPLEATRKAMRQISGAIIGVTVVLISVFVPLAFFAGSTGNIYRQFSAVMVASIAFSAFMALSLTPALCATLLKPVEAGHHHEKRGFFGWFNRGFSRTAKGYEGIVARILQARGALPRHLRGDHRRRGADVPAAADLLPAAGRPGQHHRQRAAAAGRDAGAHAVGDAAGRGATSSSSRKCESMVGVLGFSFSGQGQNAGLAFVTLKDWDAAQGRRATRPRRWPAVPSARCRASAMPSSIRSSPPPIPELGNASGFTFRLQDRGGAGHEALINARNQMLGMAAQEHDPDAGAPGRPGRRAAAADRHRPRQGERAGRDLRRDQHHAVDGARLELHQRLPEPGPPAARGGAGRRAGAHAAGGPAASSTPATRKGEPVPLSAFATTRWVNGAQQTVRYNGYPAIRISGSAAPGYSSGAAMAEMEKLAAQLPPGFGYEWTGQSREEKLAGAQAIILYGFSILAVFLCLAALYESWTIPLSVILVVPLGVLGVLLATLLRAYSNDVYFQVGLITIIGLSAKNAILIIEFAKDLQAQGKGVVESALAAAHLRFRPIVMTSLAFGLGVLPLVLAIGRGLGEPARDRHRRARRHGDRHRAGGVLRAGVLRGRAQPVQGQRAPAREPTSAMRKPRASRRKP